jgi:hypothetical protein
MRPRPQSRSSITELKCRVDGISIRYRNELIIFLREQLNSIFSILNGSEMNTAISQCVPLNLTDEAGREDGRNLPGMPHVHPGQDLRASE